MEAVKNFFAEHPEANECYTALGYARATEPEAQALLAGVSGHQVEKHMRAVEEAPEPVVEETPEPVVEEAPEPVVEEKKKGKRNG